METPLVRNTHPHASTLEWLTLGDGCRLSYRLDGASNLPVLMLSNSIATSHQMWDEQVADLTRHFRVLRYDTRGHGGSDAPAGLYSLDRLGRDVVELLDALCLDRVHFCGLSLGGFVGQWLGYRAPERIDRLILSNTSPHLAPATHWDALIHRLLQDRDMSAMADMFMHNWFPPTMFKTRAAVIKRFRAMVMEICPEGLAGCFAAVRDADLRRSNRLIEVPTLVLGGEFDTVTVASHSEEIAREIKGAELAILPGVHLLNVELSREFMERVVSFLAPSTSSVI